MKNTITTSNGKYLIRGNRTARQLRANYAAFIAKFNSTMTLDEWLRTRGAVYVKIANVT